MLKYLKKIICLTQGYFLPLKRRLLNFRYFEYHYLFSLSHLSHGFSHVLGEYFSHLDLDSKVYQRVKNNEYFLKIQDPPSVLLNKCLKI